MTADGAWTLWALGFEKCPFQERASAQCHAVGCGVDGLLSFLFFVLKAGEL